MVGVAKEYEERGQIKRLKIGAKWDEEVWHTEVRSTVYDQHNHIKIANKSFEDVVRFNHLETTVTDQSFIHEKKN